MHEKRNYTTYLFAAPSHRSKKQLRVLVASSSTHQRESGRTSSLCVRAPRHAGCFRAVSVALQFLFRSAGRRCFLDLLRIVSGARFWRSFRTGPKIRDTNTNDIPYPYSGSFSAVSESESESEVVRFSKRKKT